MSLAYLIVFLLPPVGSSLCTPGIAFSNTNKAQSLRSSSDVAS